jgi:2-dehydropantoate 2-reductase
MLQHIESGRETEIDALNGALVEKARLHGIPTPINEVVVQVIKGREAALRAAGGQLAGSADEGAGLHAPRHGRWGS